MDFNITAWIMNPFVLMFITILSGMLFGKLQFGKFSFGISGCLFTGLIVGWGVLKYAKTLDGNKYATDMIMSGVIPKNFFYLFLVLFVASVGLLASKDMGVVLKKYGTKFIILGILITFLGAASTYGMTLINSKASPYAISGVYTGALTSSPGLAAAIETATGHATDWSSEYESISPEDKEKFLNILDQEGLTSENTPTLTEAQKDAFINNAAAEIGVGHAIGYPIGVIVVIIVVNFFPKLFNIDVEDEKKKYRIEMEQARSEIGGKQIEEVSFDLTAFILACFVGFTLGKVKISLGPLGFLSLGATGGVLIGSLILGHIGKLGPLNFRMNNKILGTVRQISLAFFLSVVGLRYGFKVFESLAGTGAYLALVSLVVCIFSMFIGFFIGRYVFKINWTMLSGAICGGMTSTPGLGAAVDALGSDDPATGYGATYPFALLGMVVFTIVLHNLPM
jgi:putative transport protein